MTDRGVQPDMYRGKLWTMRQYAGFSTAEESNKRYHYLLSQGVMGLIRCIRSANTDWL
jgi:methylmalonyl-CoA mutase N-terminal domain/subunit